MNNQNKKRKIVLKITVIILSILAVALVCYAFFPLLKNINTEEGRLSFKAKVNSMGLKGFLLLYLLETVQILFVVIPGEPIELLYGMCYGSIKGAIYLTITVFLNTIIVYYIVKKFGRKVLDFFFSEEKIKKFEQKEIFNRKDKIEHILTLLFFLPGTPKDMLLYIGAFLPISKWKFICISTFARFPSVISSTLAGANIAVGDWKLGIILYAIIVIAVAILAFIYQKFDKEKITSEALKTIK